MFAQMAVYAATGTADQDSLDAEYMKDVTDLIIDRYNGQITSDQLTQGALKGVFSTMDAYTTFFTPDEAADFMREVEGTFTGIGISMGSDGDYIMVTKVFAGAPAERAGMMPGDRIVNVDGKNMVGVSLDEASSLLLGEADTKVKVGVLRNGQQGILYFEVTRGLVRINPVTYEIKDGVGYIKLDMFNSNTKDFMDKALQVMDDSKVTKIVLDLRGNPGGEVSQALSVASNFVPKGIITRLDYKSEAYDDVTYISRLENPKYKLAVLVDGMSASASEIVAGAVQDTDAGTLIGTKTFGKAKVQDTIPLLTPEAVEKYEKKLGTRVIDAFELQLKYKTVPKADEIMGLAKITVGFYYTPDGKLIDGKGVTPDIVVADTLPVAGIDAAGIEKLNRTVKPGLNDVGPDVYNAEKILKVLGYDVDAPDMTLDQKTFKAVAQFQKDVKLYSYGVLDFTTQKALNDALNGILLKYDKQYAKALEVLNK